eukprot:TRINITY_DN46661_c0_g1_i1.p1 TRINITY_DN46661_c0_g1~~TRINITY_DN46661_c0_g1_i1.p1  ORF type:complete len:262 (+),score=-12.55 TRINITY_DN46661_c0_g1_i1:60-788(+)
MRTSSVFAGTLLMLRSVLVIGYCQHAIDLHKQGVLKAINGKNDAEPGCSSSPAHCSNQSELNGKITPAGDHWKRSRQRPCVLLIGSTDILKQSVTQLTYHGEMPIRPMHTEHTQVIASQTISWSMPRHSAFAPLRTRAKYATPARGASSNTRFCMTHLCFAHDSQVSHRRIADTRKHRRGSHNNGSQSASLRTSAACQQTREIKAATGWHEEPACQRRADACPRCPVPAHFRPFQAPGAGAG